MPKLVVLGSSYAIPDAHHENTHLALVEDDGLILVDCVGTPSVRLGQAGLNYHDVRHIFLSHFHPDHVSGVPQLMMSMGLSDHRLPVDLYGLDEVVDSMLQVLDFYAWKTWHEFDTRFHRLAAEENVLALETPTFKIYTSPVVHFVPTIAFRFEQKISGKVLAYSCDTAPTESFVRLASGADIMIHEAGGASSGHSSAAQAGEIARQAGVDELYLIHYPTGNFAYQQLAEEAADTFGKPVKIAEDLMEIEF